MAEWLWEDHPAVGLSDFCANGDCRRCVGTFLGHDNAESESCGHPCHYLPSGGKRCWAEDRSVPGKAIIGVDCVKGEGVLFVVDYTATGGEVRFCPACGSPVAPWADPGRL